MHTDGSERCNALLRSKVRIHHRQRWSAVPSCWDASSHVAGEFLDPCTAAPCPQVRGTQGQTYEPAALQTHELRREVIRLPARVLRCGSEAEARGHSC